MRKTLLTVACAGALVVGSAAATMAYLTDDDAVTNTFTVGQVSITLDEENTDGKDAAGKANASKPRDKANKYHLIPGESYKKDPTVHFGAESEASYLFIKVENGLSAIESDADNYLSIAGQIKRNGWSELDGSDGIYWKEVGKNAPSDTNDYLIFSSFAIDGDVTNNELASYANANVNVTAYAVQKAGFGTAAAAWSATFGK